jgi:predicted nucleic acid-binding protein
MAKQQRRPARRAAPAAVVPQAIEDPYWQEQVRLLGRSLFFLDTGAILGALTPGNRRFSDFIEQTLVGEKLVTSAFVVAETVRRIVKSKHEGQVGPRGERGKDLALFVTSTWLPQHAVTVLHVPEPVFDAARDVFRARSTVPCDLTDIISYQIVKGLGQNRIVAEDRHFEMLGLTCLPGQ